VVDLVAVGIMILALVIGATTYLCQFCTPNTNAYDIVIDETNETERTNEFEETEYSVV
jgi:hypothetical protein